MNKDKALKVIAWVEMDISTANLLKRANVNMSTRRNELRKRLTWLTSDVQILNIQNYHSELEGMEVSTVN